MTNIPNLLTFFRILLIPVFVILFYLPYQWSYMAAALVFILAAATDWFDGYLARKLNQSTAFGAFPNRLCSPSILKISSTTFLSVDSVRHGTYHTVCHTDRCTILR